MEKALQALPNILRELGRLSTDTRGKGRIWLTINNQERLLVSKHLRVLRVGDFLDGSIAVKLLEHSAG